MKIHVNVLLYIPLHSPPSKYSLDHLKKVWWIKTLRDAEIMYVGNSCLKSNPYKDTKLLTINATEIDFVNNKNDFKYILDKILELTC